MIPGSLSLINAAISVQAVGPLWKLKISFQAGGWTPQDEAASRLRRDFALAAFGHFSGQLTM